MELSLQLKYKLGKEVLFVAPKDIVHEELFKKLEAEKVGYLKGHLWEQIDLPIYLRKNNSPLLLNLCSTAPIFYKNKIVTHHDITYIRHPESFSKSFVFFYRLLMPLILKSSRKIVTVSNFSKNEISTFYKISASKFVVIYNAADKDKFRKISRDNLNHRRKYLLAVSSINKHKNFELLINTFLSFNREYKDMDLLIVGDNNVNSFKKLNSDKKKIKNIYFLGRVDDEKLVGLYQNAFAFVFPSLYEGFGIPPIEAQSCGCPVISSNAACLPEVLGNSVCYFDPNSDSDLLRAMKLVANDGNLRNKFINLGAENVERFTWNKSSDLLIKYLKEYAK